MRRRRFLELAALSAAWPLASRAAGAVPAGVTALVGGELIDGYGGEPLADSVVLVEGERIAAIGTVGTLGVPDGATVVSTEGCAVLPGLWDLNVHLTRLGHPDAARWDELYLPLAERVVMPLALSQLLKAGVTTVRDVGSPLSSALEMRDRVRGLRVSGPKILVSGPLLGTGAPEGARSYRLLLSGAKDARARTTALVREGVDCLVVADAARFDGDELAAIVSAARAAQSPVHALIARDADLAPALSAGVDGLIGVGDGAGPWPAEAGAALGARLGAGRPLVVASTLSPVGNYAWLVKDHEPLDDPHWREGWPPVVADDVRTAIGDLSGLAATYPDAPARYRAAGERIKVLIEAGALVVVGSGAGEPAHLPGRATAQEVEALVTQAGLTPMEAIRRATYWPAVACGVQHESGTVTVGKFADLVCVRGDVLRHVDRLADVECVIRRGVREL